MGCRSKLLLEGLDDSKVAAAHVGGVAVLPGLADAAMGVAEGVDAHLDLHEEGLCDGGI